MAKRKAEVVVKRKVDEPWAYRVWADRDVIDKLLNMPGVDWVGIPSGNRVTIRIDARYKAEDVIAEIEALGKPSIPARAPRQQELFTLGNEVGHARALVHHAIWFLKGVEETYGVGYETIALAELQERIALRRARGHWR